VVDVRNVIHHRETLNNIGTCPPGSEYMYMCFLWQPVRDAVPVRSVGGIEISYCSCVQSPCSEVTRRVFSAIMERTQI
jgi:hypothetical protein